MPGKKLPDDEKAGGISVSIDPDLDKWLIEYQKRMKLKSKSAAVHQCIHIAKNVMEKCDAEEKLKYLMD